MHADSSMKKFMSSNKIVVDDSAYEFDQKEYMQLLDDKPWRKE